MTFAACVDLLFGSLMVLAWLAVAKSNSCIHNLFLIIPPHGPAAFPPALNWNNLSGRPQRILSFSRNSLFTAIFAYRSTKNECMSCSSRQRWTIPNLGRVLIRKDHFWSNKKVLSSTRDSPECLWIILFTLHYVRVGKDKGVEYRSMEKTQWKTHKIKCNLVDRTCYNRSRRYTLTFQHGLEDRRKLNINNHSNITHHRCLERRCTWKGSSTTAGVEPANRISGPFL